MAFAAEASSSSIESFTPLGAIVSQKKPVLFRLHRKLLQAESKQVSLLYFNKDRVGIIEDELTGMMLSCFRHKRRRQATCREDSTTL